MLGYVRVEKGELKVREYEIYTGYYCGICKSIGKRYGQIPRMTLSYDAAFLAILLASMDDASDVPSNEHCVGHRIRKKTVIRNRAVDYAGDVMLTLAWFKIQDDRADEGKLYARITSLLFKKRFYGLREKHARLFQDIEEQLDKLLEYEKSLCSNLDQAAEPFSQIMRLIFVEGVKQIYGKASPETERWCEKLAQIGYHMGKWIYLIDALDDIDENIGTGSYNPLIYRFGYDCKKENAATFKNRIKSRVEFNLRNYLAAISNSLDSLEIRKNEGIIENVIYLGLNRKTDEILQGEHDESI